MEILYWGTWRSLETRFPLEHLGTHFARLLSWKHPQELWVSPHQLSKVKRKPLVLKSNNMCFVLFLDEAKTSDAPGIHRTPFALLKHDAGWVLRILEVHRFPHWWWCTQREDWSSPKRRGWSWWWQKGWKEKGKRQVIVDQTKSAALVGSCS